MKGKLFWAFLALEAIGATWIGWSIAKAETKPWARLPKDRR